MARSLRPQFQGAIYHLIVRGNNHQRLFRDNHDRRYYLELLGRYRGRFGCLIYAYILLSNNLHILLATPKAQGNSVCRDCPGRAADGYFPGQ